jgi:hypothetical protein
VSVHANGQPGDLYEHGSLSYIEDQARKSTDVRRNRYLVDPLEDSMACGCP